MLHNLPVPIASLLQGVALIVGIWWVSGGGPPRSSRKDRSSAFRSTRISTNEWAWGVVAGFSFAVAIHVAIVLLFRLIPFPESIFHRGYDFSFIPTRSLRWLAVVVSAISAGVIEEIGMRGYLQSPIERRFGARAGILTSATIFTSLTLTKGWAIPGMLPIIFGGGILLGLLAWASGSLIPCFIGHVLMDLGLFAYWWTGIAGEFNGRPIGVTGVDYPFLLTSTLLALSLLALLFAIERLRKRSGLALESSCSQGRPVDQQYCLDSKQRSLSRRV